MSEDVSAELKKVLGSTEGESENEIQDGGSRELERPAASLQQRLSSG